ncbi:S-layer homology domain-containing protein [Cohnella abietis]|uniref:SLH domain-containing protein n=1 Tax=Cohnella abietis TaxID=2507935 RepID=A0A3T1D1E4_9BACL|nr:S-layer homology domain-containing protein [Cohnella abietis]BBI31920.1 hypothetical protein KCTCHS21_13190 [Cohnella abietis]
MLKKALLIYLIVSVIFTGFGTFLGGTAGVASAEELIEHNIPDWGFGGGAQADYSLDSSTAHGGTYSLRLNNLSPAAPNVYFFAVQRVQVKPNTDYTLSAWVKADNASTTWFGGGPTWLLRNHVATISESYDWRHETISYTTGPQETTFDFRILMDGPVDHIWFDDISMVEAGTTNNIIKNGDFEKKSLPVVILPDVTSNQQVGEVQSGTSVQLNNSIAGATIHYTTDGSDPRTSVTSKIYIQPIIITEAITIKAYATKPESLDSNVINFEYWTIDRDVQGWLFGGNAQADFTLDRSTVHSGSYSLRLNNQTLQTPNMYFYVAQEAEVEPNTTYDLSVWVKADNASMTWFGGGPSWGLRISVANDKETYDWQYKTIQYTTGPEETSFDFRILTEGKTDHIWFDDVSMVRVGTTDNVIKNGGFEKPLPDVTSSQQDGEVPLGTNIQLHNAIVGAEIRYTTDGSDPRTSETKMVYSQPITISQAMTIKAYATKSDSPDSNVVSFVYSIGSVVAGESFLDLEQFNNKLGEGRKAPILKANNIQIDGNMDEWSSYTGVKIPVNEKQIPIPGWGGESDLSALAKFAYDDDSFYMAIKVKDNVHHTFPDSLMWLGDSVQIAFSQDGMYGPEYAFSLNDGQPQVWRFAEGKATLDIDSLTYQAKRIGDETMYEAKIPWLAIFDTKPSAGDRVPFTFLVNDNDNDGRGRRWIEWTSAIGFGKDPKGLAELQLVPQQDNWSVSLDGNQKFAVNDANPFTIYVPNFSNQPLQVKVNSDFFHLVNKQVVVPAQSIWKKDIPVTLPTRGSYTADVSVLDETRGITKQDALQFSVSSNPNELRNRLNALEQKLPALESLLASVEAQKIPADYEKINVTILKNFIKYAKEDIDHDYLDRATYNTDELDKLYADAESNLQAYLEGTKTPIPVPRYMNGNVQIQGNSFIADTKITGADEIVRRPVFFNGYGHFAQVKQDVPQFTGYGTNIVQIEIGPNSVIRPKGYFSDWSLHTSGGVQASALLDSTISHSGKASLRLNNTSPSSPNVYMQVSQTVPAKPNTTYEMKMWVKGENVNGVSFTGDPSWGNRVSFPTGTYNWTEVTNSYTTKSDETQIGFVILSENVVGNVWIDDISLTEQGVTGNLLKNGNFDQDYVDLGSEEYVGDTTSIKNDVVSVLQNADENNIAVNLLISPHYFPGWALAKWPELKSESVSFIQFNINDPRARAIMEDYLRLLIPLIKDYKSLHSITLSNETVYQSYRDAFNLPKWQLYLQQKYPSIQQLNETYQTTYQSFNDVPMPANVTRTPLFYDWVQFNNNLFGEWHQWMADIIHDMAPGIPLHAKVMNGALSDVTALTWGVDSEQFTEFSEINGNDSHSYYGGGPAGYTEELKFYDFQASLKKAPVFNSEDHLVPDGSEQYIPEIASHVNTVLWQGAVHGRGASTIWVWERSDDVPDFKGSIMNRPDVVARVGKTNLDLNRLAEEVTAFQNDEAKAAILYSMNSMIYSRAYPKAINEAYNAITYSGLKVGFVSEKQARSGVLDGIKVLFVPEATHINADTLVSLQHFVEQGGKLVITGSDSLSFDEYNRALSNSVRNQVINNANTTLIASNTFAKQIRETVTPIFAEVGLNEVMLMDTATNLPVYDVEWRSVWQNDRLLINIDNYSSVVKSVYVQVNGQRIGNWKDLISSTTAVAADTLLLSPLQPYLLSVEPTGITLDSESYTIKVGETHDTVVHAAFESGVNQLVTSASSYVSSHPNIATVDINGKVTAVAKGTAQITVTYHGKQAIISVNSVSDDTTETPNPPINNIGGSNKDNITKVTLENGKAVAKLEKNQTTATVPLTEIGDHPFQVQAGAVMVNIDQVQLNALRNQGGNEAGATIEVQLKPVVETGGMSTSSQGTAAQIKLAGQVYEISVRLIKANGSTIEVKQISGSVDITLPYDANGVDSELLGIYYYNETTKQWEYVGGQLNSSAKTMTVKLQHLSKYAVLQYSKTFSDVPATHWAARTLQILAAKHVVNGVSDNLFQPAGETTRAEFVALLVRALNLEAAEDVKAFKDVKSDAWYAGSVQAAVKAGIVTGVSVDRFAPNAPISRAEMAVLIARALGLKDDASVKVDFADSKDIPLWAISSVAELKKMGLIQGNGHNRFNPQANATRAEAAKLILGTINQLK